MKFEDVLLNEFTAGSYIILKKEINGVKPARYKITGKQGANTVLSGGGKIPTSVLSKAMKDGDAYLSGSGSGGM